MGWGEGGQKSAKKVSRIIWMAPKSEICLKCEGYEFLARNWKKKQYRRQVALG